jgi:hypothetical protein
MDLDLAVGLEHRSTESDHECEYDDDYSLAG